MNVNTPTLQPIKILPLEMFFYIYSWKRKRKKKNVFVTWVLRPEQWRKDAPNSSLSISLSLCPSLSLEFSEGGRELGKTHYVLDHLAMSAVKKNKADEGNKEKEWQCF